MLTESTKNRFDPVKLPRCKLCGTGSVVLYHNLSDRLFSAPGTWRLVRCTADSCGLVWMDPPPSPDVLSAAYEDYYTHNGQPQSSPLRRQYDRFRSAYLARKFKYEHGDLRTWEIVGGLLLGLIPHRRAAFDAAVMWLPAKRGGRVLEVGCGNGELLFRLQSLGWHVHGIEPDAKAAAIAKARGVTVTDSLTSSDLVANSFDAIVMSHVIEHVADPVAVMRTCKDLLKSGGVLVMLTPNIWALGHKWLGRDWLHLDPPRHLHLFSPKSISVACRMAGFPASSCRTTVRDASWTLGGSIVLKRGRRYRMGALPWRVRSIATCLQYIEWFAMTGNRDVGEELLAIAQKQ